MIILILSSFKKLNHNHNAFLNKYISRLAIIGLVITLIIACQYNLNLKFSLFNDTLISNSYLQIVEIFILISSILLLFLNSTQLNNVYGRFITEYPLICLFTIIGSILLIKSNNLMIMFLAIELQSYSVYALCVIYNETENSTKAGLKYFFLGGLASIFILLGISIIYGETGLLNLESLKVLNNYENSLATNGISFGIAVMLIGYLFKIGAAPFHNWAPDVYNEVPTKITAWISVIPKISILVFIGSLFEFILNINVFLIAGILSILIGAIGGVSQINFKRLLAYSGITNVGYLLLALGSYTSYVKEGFIIYLMQYTIISINIFILMILLGIYASKIYGKSSILSPIRLIKDLENLYKFNPVLIICLSVSLFSLIGIPPLIGFYSKYWLIQEILTGGLMYPSLILILGSVISSYYYLNVIKVLYQTDDNTNVSIQSELSLSPLLAYIGGSLTIFTIFMFLDFDSILQGTHIITSITLN